VLLKILTLQFRSNPNAILGEQACLLRQVKDSNVNLDFMSALDELTDWSKAEELLADYAGVIFGGSGDLDFDGNRPADDVVRLQSVALLERMRPFFEYLFAHDIPTLGICYGHQIIGAFSGARVHCDVEQKKIRSHEVTFVVDRTEYELFADLPASFYAHYGHKDVLDRVPTGAILLLQGGDNCRVSALQYQSNIYTVQFHPELTFADMLERMKNSPGYLPEGVAAEEVFIDDPSSNTIISNFAKLVQKKQFK
jgi:GMP synthase-like glutamine amidotransferase